MFLEFFSVSLHIGSFGIFAKVCLGSAKVHFGSAKVCLGFLTNWYFILSVWDLQKFVWDLKKFVWDLQKFVWDLQKFVWDLQKFVLDLQMFVWDLQMFVWDFKQIEILGHLKHLVLLPARTSRSHLKELATGRTLSSAHWLSLPRYHVLWCRRDRCRGIVLTPVPVSSVSLGVGP